MTQPFDRALVWLRRDLRVDDNAALYHALKAARQVYCAFILDRDILDALPRTDRRVEFILGALQVLDEDLRRLGGALIVRHGCAADELPRLAAELGVQAVFANHDDEPQALMRDALVAERLASFNTELRTFKDHVVFERSEVMTAAGGAYSVFTPYKNAWLRKVDAFYLSGYPVERHAAALARSELATGVPTLTAIGFQPAGLTDHVGQGSRGAAALLDDFLDRIADYDRKRDFPALKGPSYLSVHLRFGTVSIRRLARIAHQLMQGGDHGAEVWLSELIWRDFYHQVMHHHPHAMTAAFRPEYDAIAWETGAHADRLFQAWCEGRTGYPLVDAAMRQLKATGYMHNRLRMYWGKKIIEWTADPEEAFATTMALNNRWFLDGRDANSFANVGWLFGLHDRPWPARPVFGTVRSMGAASLKKFDAEAYVAAVERLAAAEEG
jgi:deoxyribodipyrimidine photo-lyase